MWSDADRLYIIGGGDDADRVTQDGSKIIVTGTTDLTKLLLDRVPHHRLHVTRNFFRQGRRPDLDGYKILLNMVTEPEQNQRTLDNMRKLLRGAKPGSTVLLRVAFGREGRALRALTIPE